MRPPDKETPRNRTPAAAQERTFGTGKYNRPSPPGIAAPPYEVFRACAGCGGPILPPERRGTVCGTCADWISGKALREEIARANAARTLRQRRIGGRRVLVDLVMQVVRDELFGNWEAS
jgi:hypothetical protein